MWQCRTQHGPRRHGGVHIDSPDPATSAQTCCCTRAGFGNTQGLQLSPLTQRELLWCPAALLGGTGNSAVVSTAQIHVGRTQCCAPVSFLARSSNVYSTRHQWEAEGSSKSSLTALRKDGGALQQGHYRAWDLDFIFSNPQSKSPLAKGCFGKVAVEIHQKPCKHLHWFYFTISICPQS